MTRFIVIAVVAAFVFLGPTSSQAEWPNFGLERGDNIAKPPKVKSEDEGRDDNYYPYRDHEDDSDRDEDENSDKDEEGDD